MNFTVGFLALLAAAQSIVAFPFGMSQAEAALAPSLVTKLACDGDTFLCTANLDFGDGKWVAQWGTSVFHTGLFGAPNHKEAIAAMAMAPIAVSQVNCDGNTFICTANLNFGDVNWVAQWTTAVFHQSFTSGNEQSFAPAPVTQIACNGSTFKCTANLNFADGKWVAQWNTNVLHTSSFFAQN